MYPRFPFRSTESDFYNVAKRGGLEKFGKYGTIVYFYQAAFEYLWQAQPLYHPVDTPEEAEEMLEYYRSKTRIGVYFKEKAYPVAYFLARPPI